MSECEHVSLKASEEGGLGKEFWGGVGRSKTRWVCVELMSHCHMLGDQASLCKTTCV